MRTGLTEALNEYERKIEQIKKEFNMFFHGLYTINSMYAIYFVRKINGLMEIEEYISVNLDDDDKEFLVRFDEISVALEEVYLNFQSLIEEKGEFTGFKFINSNNGKRIDTEEYIDKSIEIEDDLNKVNFFEDEEAIEKKFFIYHRINSICKN